MRNKDFAHLHLHNEFSALDGMGSAKQYASRAKKMGFEYLALTNHGNIDGLIDFQKECLKQGIKPVLGVEAYIVPKAEEKKKGEKRGHITLLVKNEQGWANLCRLLTFANTKGFYYRPRIDFEAMLIYYEGLVILTGCASSFVNIDGGVKFLKALKRRVRKDLYLEIMPHNITDQCSINFQCKELAQDLGIDTVATNDCHYVNREDYETQEVLLAIQRKAKWNDPKRWKFGIAGLHLRNVREMLDAFKAQGCFKKEEIKAAMAKTREVAEKCASFRIESRSIDLPPVETEGKTELAFLHTLARRGLESIFEKPFAQVVADYDSGDLKAVEYLDRYLEELILISNKKFIRYFLIVWDTINFCNRSGILVGPGRGSVGGSLIAYLIGITKVDPIRFGLYFDRFINKDRIDYPDIDIDFADRYRHLVREYIESKYGKDHVASVSTFIRMNSKAIVRDVGRVFDVPLKETDEFSKAIDDTIEEDAIEHCIDSTTTGKIYSEKYPEVIRHAKALEGQVKARGRHAAALIVSNHDLMTSDKCNLVKAGDQLVVNWEKENAEKMGLLKLDYLGLKALSIISNTIELVKEKHKRELALDSDVPLDDKVVLEEINKGNTVGVFQANTFAMRKLIEEMGIHSFNDLCVSMSLVRPGPKDSGMTDEYIRRKHGAKWEKKNDIYEQVLEETLGIVCYQEQVMAIISKVAGLPYSTADKIRKIIGKKRDPKEFEEYREKFAQGCVSNKTLSRAEAMEFWDGLEKHARYSFNKAHSVEYSLMSYWTAFLKYYYPSEFLCASLTYGAETKKEELIKEAHRLGLEIIPPKVGISKTRSWVADKHRLFIPLIEVKGVGEKSLEKMDSITCKVNNGFYRCRGQEKIKGSAGKALEAVGAYDLKEEISKKQEEKYFSFKFLKEKTHPIAIKKIGYEQDKEMSKCQKCSLWKQGRGVVLPSKGKHNVAIIGEAPGPQEDRYKRGFYEKAPSGSLLWEELKKYKLKRSMFHVSNICKCYPSDSGTPSIRQISICSEKWLFEELKSIKCNMALVFGNTALRCFTQKTGGITGLSGQREYHEQLGLYLYYCVHPSAVRRNAKANKGLWEKGIARFAEDFLSKL